MIGRAIVVPGVVAVCSCGNGGVHHLSDGGTDAPRLVDAPRVVDAPGDASSGPVTAAITLDGAPLAGSATVYFQTTDSTLVAELQTGSDGTATHVIAAGGLVTVVLPNFTPLLPPNAATTPNDQSIITWVGVEPGDVLHVDLGFVDEEPPFISFPVTVPTDGSATTYTLLTTCGNTSIESGEDVARGRPRVQGPSNVTIEDCAGVVDMLVLTGDESGNTFNSLYAPNVAIAAGSAVVLTQSYTPVSAQSVVLINLPSGAVDVGGSEELLTPNGQLTSFRVSTVEEGSVGLFDYSQQVTAPITALEEESDDVASLLDHQVIGNWGSASSATAVFDSSMLRLPDYTAAPTFDLASEQVQFQLTSQGDIDGVMTQVNFTRSVLGGVEEDGGIATSTATWNWFVIAPGSEVGAVALPTLPTDLFAWNGSAGDDTDVSFLELGHVTGGYDAVRSLLWDFDFDIAPVSQPLGHVIESFFEAGVPTVARAVTRPSRRGPARMWRTQHSKQ